MKKKLDLRSGSQRHRHFVGFFNVIYRPSTGTGPTFWRYFRKTVKFSCLLWQAGDTEELFSSLTPGVPMGKSMSIPTTIRLPQTKHITTSNDRGVTKPIGHYIILTKFKAVHQTVEDKCKCYMNSILKHCPLKTNYLFPQPEQYLSSNFIILLNMIIVSYIVITFF